MHMNIGTSYPHGICVWYVWSSLKGWNRLQLLVFSFFYSWTDIFLLLPDKVTMSPLVWQVRMLLETDSSKGIMVFTLTPNSNYQTHLHLLVYNTHHPVFAHAIPNCILTCLKHSVKAMLFQSNTGTKIPDNCMWVIGFFNKQQCVNFVSFCIIVKCVINLHDHKPHKRESNVLRRDKGLSKYSNDWLTAKTPNHRKHII